MDGNTVLGLRDKQPLDQTASNVTLGSKPLEISGHGSEDRFLLWKDHWLPGEAYLGGR